MKNKPGLRISFDIGTKALKAVAVETDSCGARILVYSESLALQPESSFADSDDFARYLAEQLSSLKERLPNIKSADVSFSFSHRELQVKILTPDEQLSKEGYENLIKSEGNKLLSPMYKGTPFNYASKIISKTPFSFALAVVPAKVLEPYQEAFLKSGITVRDIYPHVFLNDKLQEISDINASPAFSILNFGYTGSHLQIYTGGLLKFYRFIPAGSSDMQTPPTEKELDNYAQKIRFSFDYFRAVTKQTSTEEMMVIGGSAAEPSVLSFFARYFNPTKITTPKITNHLALSPSKEGDLLSSTSEATIGEFIPVIMGAFLSEKSGNRPESFLESLRQEAAHNRETFLSVAIPIAVLLFTAFAVFSIKLATDYSLITANVQSITPKPAKPKENTTSDLLLSCGISQNSLSQLEKLMDDSSSLFELYKKIFQAKPSSNIIIEEILLRTAEESETLELPEPEEDTTSGASNGFPQAESLMSKPLYTTSLEISEDNILSAELSGKIIVIKGRAADMPELGNYLGKLVEPVYNKKERTATVLIKKITKFTTRASKHNSLDFLIQAEML